MSVRSLQFRITGANFFWGGGLGATSLPVIFMCIESVTHEATKSESRSTLERERGIPNGGILSVATSEASVHKLLMGQLTSTHKVFGVNVSGWDRCFCYGGTMPKTRTGKKAKKTTPRPAAQIEAEKQFLIGQMPEIYIWSFHTRGGSSGLLWICPRW